MQAFPRLGRAGDDGPHTVADQVQLQGVRNLGKSYFVSGQRLQQILLVGENEQWDPSQLLISQEGGQFLAALLDSPSISTVDHVDEGVGVVEVVAPVGTDGALPADVPDVEFESFMNQRLDVEPLRRRDVRDIFIRKSLQNSRLPGVVETED